MKIQALVLLACTYAVTPVIAQDSSQAESIFAQYQSRERAFDPSVADLYCDTALIRNVRTYPDGQQRTLELPASKYKTLIRMAMPLAEAKGDFSTYSNPSFAPEGAYVRVTATRYSVLKKYSSPISLLIGSCSDGAIGILEELGESQP